MKKEKTIYPAIIVIIGLILFTRCASKMEIKKKDIEKTVMADTVKVKAEEKKEKSDNLVKKDTGLSPATELMIRACDNYLALNDSGQKAAEVLSIKANLLYNKRLFEWSRTVYNQILEKYENTQFYYDAMRMIAQSYYEEKRFDEAQKWYRKLSYVAQSVPDRENAVQRIAESIFRMAEAYEEKKMFKDAAAEYERISLEFPEAKIADIALFNSGLAYEKLTEWSHAILIFQRLINKYGNSQLLPKAQFRIAKNYEKMLQWDYAADAYIKVALEYTKSDLGPLALYNAGFCLENAGKLKEAAATFEKLSTLYPQSPDAPDVLFKAGEIYGKIKDWQSVTRVNQIFTSNFGSDQDRIIQALCMGGIALYMQSRETEAMKQLEKAAITFAKMKEPSSVNAYYAAKAIFTIGEIYHQQMSRINLSSQRSIYKKQLDEKSGLLDKAIESYSKVIKFNISEWTTRSIFQIGQIYEDFGIGIFRQQRPSFKSLEERMSLELGIAKAVEKYFVENALYYHELNVKLGIKEEFEDKYITQSRQKLTLLPYLAGENYLALVNIATNSAPISPEGFSSIAITLQTLQKVAPFQEKAIDLYLKCLELGSVYRETNEFYQKAASSITGQSLLVGQTYDKLVNIAREAPIPQNFSDYERFIYKTKLLKQIESYEEQALTHYLKTLKIAESYKIADQSVNYAQEHIARLLFNKGWCYDLLATDMASNPPFPHGISQEERDEFKERFQEIEKKFSSQALEIYKTLMDYSTKKFARGQYLTHAYMRLYQILPQEYGVEEIQNVRKTIAADSLWICSVDSMQNWTEMNVNDSGWKKPVLTSATPQNHGPEYGLSYNLADNIGKVYFRRRFQTQSPCSTEFFIDAKGEAAVFLNGKKILSDTVTKENSKIVRWRIDGKINDGENILAIGVNKNSSDISIYPVLHIWEKRKLMVPRPPGEEKNRTFESGKIGVHKFPYLKNFSMDMAGVQR
jgi:tetratricopeptide (TPR) repeat protein